MRPEPLFTPAETAKVLGMSVDTLLAHVRNGDISYVLIGLGTKNKRRRFAPSDIARFQDRQRRTEQSPLTGAKLYALPKRPDRLFDPLAPTPRR